MPEISRRRADQFGDFVAVLKLRAIDLDDRAGVLHQRFGGGFHDARLTRSGGPEEQEVSDRTPGRRHAGQMHLINVDDLLDGFVLTDNHSAQAGFKSFCLSSGPRRI